MVGAVMKIVPFYAGVLGLFYIFLSVRIIKMRHRMQVVLGDGNDPALSRAIRAHGNFAEYVPLGLVLAGLLELQGHSHLLLHLIGTLLLGGRFVHAFGLSQVEEKIRYRVVGMQLTFAAIAVASFMLIFGGPGIAGQ